MVLGSCLWPLPVSALTGNHEVIVAYYPIFPRWYTPQFCLFIGDLTRQYPLLGLYDNRTNTGVMQFDMDCMKNMGATTVATHLFGPSLDTSLCDRLDASAGAVGIRWTPIFEAFTSDPMGMANIVNSFVANYGTSDNLMRVDGRIVLFWTFHAVAEQSVAAAIDNVRAVSGPVMIILDNVCRGVACQACCNGSNSISPWFSDPDPTTGYPRVGGYYYWAPVVGWCTLSRADRRTHVDNFVNRCVSGGAVPVLCTTPSYNEENWGYGVEGDNCGIAGDRSNQPHYNTTRSLAEWSENLDDLFYNNHADAWMYIQAYDEWAEGSVISPTTYSCFDFLAEVREKLQGKGWLAEVADYCRPMYPASYDPTGCTSTPVCSDGTCSGGVQPTGGGSTPDAWATYQAENTAMGHLTGFQTPDGWRATVDCPHDTYLAFGPYATNIPTGGLTARFWLSVGDNSSDDQPIARIDVYDADVGMVLAQRTIRRSEWTAANTYKAFNLPFENPVAGHALEFRTYYIWYAQLDLDKVEVLGVPLVNQAPSTEAGMEQTVSLSGIASLDGTVSDDGLPEPPGVVTAAWSKVSGPGAVSFGAPAACETSAAFSEAGTYVLRLTATDSLLSSHDDVIVIVRPDPGDLDGDGDVDQADFGRMQLCLSGDGYAYPTGCDDADLDGDGDVDHIDVFALESCLAGPNHPPGC